MTNSPQRGELVMVWYHDTSKLLLRKILGGPLKVRAGGGWGVSLVGDILQAKGVEECFRREVEGVDWKGAWAGVHRDLVWAQTIARHSSDDGDDHNMA
eukprot:gene4393-biopygen1562